jgi:hypothetical protein
MARKPATKPTKAPPLRQIQQETRLLEAQIRHKKVAREHAILEALERWQADDWWARSDPVSRHGDLPRGAIAQPSDRRGGDNWPLFRTEEEHRRLTQDARICVASNSYAEGLLNNFRNYVIGKGFTYKAKERRKDTPPKLVKQTQDAIDRFCAANDWNSGCAYWPGDNTAARTREQEGFDRTRRDGELFIRLFRENGELLSVRFVEPELIRNPPDGTRQDGWTYGIRHKVYEGGGEDVETILEYHIATVDGAEGEYVPANDIIHVKINVDRNIKRGLTDFRYSTLANLTRAALLQRNLSESSIAQAAVAEIQQWESATESQLSEYAAGKVDQTVVRPNENGGRSVGYERREAGSVRYVPKGVEFVPPPWSNGTPAHQAVLQGDLRGSATGFCAPEYLASGDASNANYASTKEAGAPFTKNGETTQELYKGAYLKVIYAALRHEIERGELPPETLQLVEVQVEAPNVVTTNRLEQAQADQVYVGLGALDRQTVAMRNGDEWDTVKQNNLEYQETFGQQGAALPMPGGEKPAPGTGNPFGGMEGLLETKDASGHEHAADGKFGSGGSKKPTRASEANAKYKELVAQAKQHRIEAFNAAKADAQAAHEKVNAHADAAREHMDNIAWDTDDPEQAAFTELESLIADYDPDWTASDRHEHLKDIEAKAKEAAAATQKITGKPDDLSADDVASNKQRLSQIIDNVQQARKTLKEYVSHRRDMQSIKLGEGMGLDWLECGGEGGTPGPCPHPGSAEQATVADGIVNDAGFLAKVKALPKAAVKKAVGIATGIYQKAEQKYGPKWAKAILATAIVTAPTPFTTPAVLAMTGIAHLWTKYKAAPEAVYEGADMTPDEIEAAAAELLKALGL